MNKSELIERMASDADISKAAAERAQVARWLAASTKRAALDDDLYGGE